MDGASDCQNSIAQLVIVYVDLSAKVEHWTKASAIAVSNGGSRVYLITGKVKQRLRRLLAGRHGRQSLQYRVLALFVYLAVRDQLPRIRQIVIDRDYSGAEAEATIKNLLLPLLQRDRPTVTAGFIRFENVKDKPADILAREVFENRRAADRVVSFQELMAILEE